MRRTRMLAVTGAVALTATVAGPMTTMTALAAPTATAAETGSYIVLADEGADARAVANKLRAAGATVTSMNTSIGMISIKGSKATLAKARAVDGVQAAASERLIGRSPVSDKRDSVIKEHVAAKAKQGKATASTKAGAKVAIEAAHDPLDGLLWGHEMIKAFDARALEMGDKRVKVGIMDTGVQADHPDLAPNFDHALSKNFTTDIPAVDGPCEFESCVDPATLDDNGHGTHVAGTIGAALNGRGMSGIAPGVDVVNVRAGQDSGYFFLGPVANALTYAGDKGIDVVNMSFYVDPWLYNCKGGAPEDSPEEAAQQDLTIATMNRALRYANQKNVTLVGALGNNNEDLSKPRMDPSSPNFPGGSEHDRTIDNQTCFDLPTEGPNVIGVSSLGPSGEKSDFSNYATNLYSGEIEFAAPGGWFRDYFGTPQHRTNENLILSAAPLHVLQAEGQVDADGNLTPDGVALGTLKDCTTVEGTESCGYYQYLQGTSMAAPHAAGVAALAVSAHGKLVSRTEFGMAPYAVKRVMSQTAMDHACPAGGVRSYENEGRDESYTAKCTSRNGFNGFYGEGIVNALGVVR